MCLNLKKPKVMHENGVRIVDLIRDTQLDAIKGFAIILVIMGHILAFSNQNSNIPIQIIYSFHMQLFFFISGFLVFNHFGPTLITWIKKKFIQLIVPYGIFTLFYFFILFYPTVKNINYIDAFFKYTVGNSAWFLPVLFESFVILAICIEGEKIIKKYSYLIFFIIVLVLIPVLHLDSMNIVHQIVVYSPFVILGYLSCNFKDQLTTKILLIEIAGSGLFIVLSFLKYGLRIPKFTSNLESLYYGYLLALTGIILSWVAVKFIIKLNTSLPFVICGVFSLEIYLIHLVYINYFLFKQWPLWIGSGIEATITGTIILLFLSLGTAILLSWNRKLSTVLFGRWSFKYFISYLKGRQ